MKTCQLPNPTWTRTHTRVWVLGWLLSFVEKAEPVQVRFALWLRDQWSIWMQDGCKVYMESYMASNGPCFTVTWTVFKNHLLEVGLTQRPWHSECSQLLVYYILSCVRTRLNRNLLKHHLVEGPNHKWLHTTLEDRWPHYMILEVCWDGLCTISFGLPLLLVGFLARVCNWP